MTRSAVVHRAMQAPRGNQKVVFGVVASVLVLCSLPFLSGTVMQREQQVAAMRDASYDAKDEARNQRLSIKRSS